MLTLVNDASYNRLRRKQLGGIVTSLWKNTKIFHGSSSFPLPSYPYTTSSFTQFEKNYWNNPQDTSYHLSGYGLTLNESMVSFLGESAERFAYASAGPALKQFVENHSHQELLALSASEENIVVPPLDYINIFFTKNNIKRYLGPDDTIQWLKLASLTQHQKTTYLPLQYFMMQLENTDFPGEKHYAHGSVSTGTACHENLLQSLENAIIEYLQIDSFNL